MAKIVPLRGVRYNPGIVSDPAAVMAPPYDVISPEQQQQLYERSPYNVVRLILNQAQEGDDEHNNPYTRAAAYFQQWQNKGILVRDSEPSLYLYDQEYTAADGSRVVRQGFLALARLEDFSSGVVKPHEKTLSGPKADRLRLMQACRAQFSPIFSLYSDPCCVLEALAKDFKAEKPLFHFTDEQNVSHALWQVSDPALLARAQELLDKKPLFIADGHHRYETALAYRDQLRREYPDYSGKEPFNFVLMYFANMEDSGMQIFPTHRLVHSLPQVDLTSLWQQLEPWFERHTEPVSGQESAAWDQVAQRLASLGEQQRTFACYAGEGQVHYLSLRPDIDWERWFPPEMAPCLRQLDVSILHRLVLEEALGITAQQQEQQTRLCYAKSMSQAVTAVQEGKAQLAFLMNPTRLSEVRDVANARGKMPQKSTFFYPKLLTGPVLNKIVPEENVIA